MKEPISTANTQPPRENMHSRKAKGLATWLRLPPSILCNEGKLLVSEDPNLSEQTLEALAALPRKKKKCEFSFGYNQPNGDDSGLALLSICINENPCATLAEVVARYAESRSLPYAETAAAVSELMKKQGLIRYVDKNNRRVATEWTPVQVAIYKQPPKKKDIPVSEGELLYG